MDTLTHKIYTINDLWDKSIKAPATIGAERKEIIEYFHARWRQLLHDNYDPQAGVYVQDIVFLVATESSQLLQIIYDAECAASRPGIAAYVLLQEYINSGFQLAKDSPDISAYQAQVGLLYADLMSPYGVAVANNTLGLSNRMINAISYHLVSVLEATDTEKKFFAEGELEIFGSPGALQHVGLSSEPEHYDLSPYADYLLGHRVNNTAYSLNAVLRLIWIMNQFAVTCEIRDRGLPKEKRGFISELFLYNTYILLSNLLKKLPDTKNLSHREQRDGLKAVLADLASYTLLDLYTHFSQLGELAMECDVYALVLMQLGEKSLASAYAEKTAQERSKPGSHTLHSMGLLTQALFILKKERGDGDPILAQCQIMITCAAYWSGGMPVDTAMLELGNAEHMLLQSPKPLQGILKSEIYLKYRKDMERRVSDTL